jgi:hypothetical protein
MQRLADVQLTETQAVELCKRKWWLDLDKIAVVQFQLSQNKLCCDFAYFHSAVEEALGRSVWTHEFANPDLLWEELHEKRNPPSLEEIVSLLPVKDLVLVWK